MFFHMINVLVQHLEKNLELTEVEQFFSWSFFFYFFLAIFGLKNSRVWPKSVLGVQEFFLELKYSIRLSKKFFLVVEEL